NLTKMRISKSASTLVKKKFPREKQQLNLSKTNTFTADDFDINNRDLLDTGIHNQKTIANKRTRSAILYGIKGNNDLFIRAKHLPPKEKIKKFIKKSLPKISINQSFQTKPSNIVIKKDEINLSSYIPEKTEISQNSDFIKIVKMPKNEISEFYLQPIDPELKAYANQKKNIKEKIHEHWKLELNTHSPQKGNNLNIINDNMFKPDHQWININISKNDSSEKDKSKKISLIDTFTAEFDKPSENTETYRVNGDTGSMIAQKLSDGEKMRICRNGELVNKTTDIFDPSAFLINEKKIEVGEDEIIIERELITLENDSDEEYNKFFLFKDFSRMFSDIPIPGNSILSWNDQVKKDNIRILNPSVPQVKEEQKIKPQRNLIVKKLIDEDEFKPRVKKSPLESKDYETYGIKSPRRLTTSQSLKLPERAINKTPVEIVGFSQKKTSSEIQSNHLSLKDDISDRFNDPEEIFSVTLSPAKPLKTNGRLYENLNEKNYGEIFENLTNRYFHDKSQDSKETLGNKNKTKKVILDKRKGIPLGIELKSNPKDDKNFLKSLEKKYKNLIYHDLNNSKQTNFESESQILKNLNLYDNNNNNYKIDKFTSSSTSSTESLKLNPLSITKNSELTENINLRLKSLGDGLYAKQLNDTKNDSHTSLPILFKPLSTVITKTNKNNTKIFSN
ncbi:unnamed protein product, partial [Brachionus calyciflorus]